MSRRTTACTFRRSRAGRAAGSRATTTPRRRPARASGRNFDAIKWRISDGASDPERPGGHQEWASGALKTTTSELIEAAIGGQRHAQTTLWSAHRRWLAAILLAHKPSWVDLDDLMQEVAVKFVSRLHTLRDPGSFRPWLRRIAINAARESARGPREIATGQAGAGEDRVGDDGSGSRDRGATSFEGSSAENDAPPVTAALREEAGSLLAQALTLPPEFREPLILRSVHGIGCKQIAEILGLPVTTIETRLTRARRMLREEWRSREMASDEDRSDPGSVPASEPVVLRVGLEPSAAAGSASHSISDGRADLSSRRRSRPLPAAATLRDGTQAAASAEGALPGIAGAAARLSAGEQAREAGPI